MLEIRLTTVWHLCKKLIVFSKDAGSIRRGRMRQLRTLLASQTQPRSRVRMHERQLRRHDSHDGLARQLGGSLATHWQFRARHVRHLGVGRVARANQAIVARQEHSGAQSWYLLQDLDDAHWPPQTTSCHSKSDLLISYSAVTYFKQKEKYNAMIMLNVHTNEFESEHIW